MVDLVLGRSPLPDSSISAIVASDDQHSTLGFAPSTVLVEVDRMLDSLDLGSSTAGKKGDVALPVALSGVEAYATLATDGSSTSISGGGAVVAIGALTKAVITVLEGVALRESEVRGLLLRADREADARNELHGRLRDHIGSVSQSVSQSVNFSLFFFFIFVLF